MSNFAQWCILTAFYAFMLLLMNMSVFQDHSGVSQLTKLYFSMCFYRIKLTLHGKDMY